MSSGYTPGVPRLGVPALLMSDASLECHQPRVPGGRHRDRAARGHRARVKLLARPDRAVCHARPARIPGDGGPLQLSLFTGQYGLLPRGVHLYTNSPAV